MSQLSTSWTETERSAYQAFTSRHPATRESCLKLLNEAAYNKNVPAEETEGAILWLEQQPEAAQVQSSPNGRWRLVFGTGTKFRQLQYIPLDEDFVIQLAEGQLALESSVGPFQFEINGRLLAYRRDSNALDFQFQGVNVLLLGYKVWKLEKDFPAKTYTFFHVADDIATARSSSGGVALLRAV